MKHSAVPEGLNPSSYAPLILIVDDDKMMRSLLRRSMEQAGYRVLEAQNGQEAITLFEQHLPNLVLLDAMMPVMDGFSCCAALRKLRCGEIGTCDVFRIRTPILMITALDDSESVDRAFAAGAADYITKPIHWTVLTQRVRRLLEQVRLFEQLEKANAELEHLASIDGLTQLANRRYFDLVLEQEWRRSLREAWASQQAFPISLVLCDVDCFKLYNDRYGHMAGDSCLQEVAQAIRRAARRPADVVARYGGEEFAAILPHTDAKGAMHVAELIRLEVKQCAIAHADSVVCPYITVSVGVATMIPRPDYSPTLLIMAADVALYQAKNQGRDRAVFNVDSRFGST